MRKRDFPHGKKKDVYFKYIGMFRQKDRYKVLRYLGCMLSGT